MASYVDFLMRKDRWTELKPQLERNDDGNSHHRVLDTYLRMLSEYRRIMASRERGSSRLDYLLSREERADRRSSRPPVQPAQHPGLTDGTVAHATVARSGGALILSGVGRRPRTCP